MKRVLLFIGIVAFSTTVMAQTQVGVGDILIDPYIGFPNWANSIIYANYNGDDDASVTDYKVNGGQLSYGGRIEYMVSEDFGIGADLNYEESGYNYNQTVSTYDTITSTYINGKYNYDYKAKKFRAMFRLNFHFVQTDKVDAYTAFGAGYKRIKRAYSSNEPNYTESETAGLIPIAFRLAVGTRIYFTQNIGAHIELGAFGGGLLQFGVTVKIPSY